MLLALPLAGLPAPSPSGVAWGAAAGAGEAIGALALFAGFRNAAFSVAGPLSAVGSAGFPVLAGLLLGERPGTLAMIGIGLALPAIIGVSASPGSARPGRGRPGHAKPGRPEPHGDESALTCTNVVGMPGFESGTSCSQISSGQLPDVA